MVRVRARDPSGEEVLMMALKRQQLVTLAVTGRPATFATAHEAPWNAVAREAVARKRVQMPANDRFSVAMDFRTPATTDANLAESIRQFT